MSCNHELQRPICNPVTARTLYHNELTDLTSRTRQDSAYVRIRPECTLAATRTRRHYSAHASLLPLHPRHSFRHAAPRAGAPGLRPDHGAGPEGPAQRDGPGRTVATV